MVIKQQKFIFLQSKMLEVQSPGISMGGGGCFLWGVLSEKQLPVSPMGICSII